LRGSEIGKKRAETVHGRPRRRRPRAADPPANSDASSGPRRDTGGTLCEFPQLPDEYLRHTCPPKPWRRRIGIVRYDRSGKETRRWTLHGAWVKVLECDDLEGGNTENSIEKLTVCFQYWT